ncbi:hypothetical protein D3C77_619930 [compost metagenome]
MSALRDSCGFTVLAGFSEVLGGLLARLVQSEDADPAQRLFAPPGPGYDVGFRARSRHANKQPGDGGIVHFVFTASDLQAGQQLCGKLLFHFVPMGALWVQK